MADGKWQMANGKSRSQLQVAGRGWQAVQTGASNTNNQSTDDKKEHSVAKYQHFEELPVWQEAARLYNAVLDLLEEPGAPLTPGFRDQLDRASLSISNIVAEGFERSTTNELLSFITIARGSSGEVRSMMAVVKNRPKLKRYVSALHGIRTLAESCARQLTGWAGAVEQLPFDGKRHLPPQRRSQREAAQKANEYRLRFLRSIAPTHPLYNSAEAPAARGESVE
jgi:four helix bundle protein